MTGDGWRKKSRGCRIKITFGEISEKSFRGDFTYT